MITPSSQFYLELWKEINEHPGLRARAEAHSSLPKPAPTATAVAEGTLFDELVSQYATLTARSEDLIIQHTVSEVQSSLRSHLTRYNLFQYLFLSSHTLISL
jgi:hypothetical protein